MKKAVEINTITIENGIATITYATGTIRKYPERELPKTVKVWLEKKQIRSTDEERFWLASCGNGSINQDDELLYFGSYTRVKEHLLESHPDATWYDIVPASSTMIKNYRAYAPERIVDVTEKAETEEAEETEADVEKVPAPELPAVVEEEQEEVIEAVQYPLQTSFNEEQPEFVEPKTGILSKAADLSVSLIEATAKATKAIILTAGPVILQGIMAGLPVLVSLLVKAGFALVDLLLAFAFWFPEMVVRTGRKVWVVWPTVVTEVGILARRTIRVAVMAANITLQTVRSGWQMRAEIIAEQA